MRARDGGGGDRAVGLSFKHVGQYEGQGLGETGLQGEGKDEIVDVHSLTHALLHEVGAMLMRSIRNNIQSFEEKLICAC